jgi:hypothetical protein
MKLSLILLTMFTTTSYASEFIPEASGLCKMGDALVIAGDEEPSSVWITQGQSSSQKIKVKGAKWDDVEGLATMDVNKFFATTSHSRTKKGKRKPEREQLMLLSKNGRQIEVINSWSLREKILAQLKKSHSTVLDMETVEAAAPDEGGLNIEGLAYHSGKLYLGLRSPVTSKGEALILVIKNADALLDGKAPLFDKTMNVRLSGKGIRSLDTLKNGLFILAGSSNDTDETFSLKQFNFEPGTLQNFSLAGFSKLLRPEGVVAYEDGSVIFVQDFQEPQDQEIIVRLKPAY